MHLLSQKFLANNHNILTYDFKVYSEMLGTTVLGKQTFIQHAF